MKLHIKYFNFRSSIQLDHSVLLLLSPSNSTVAAKNVNVIYDVVQFLWARPPFPLSLPQVGFAVDQRVFELIVSFNK